MIKKAFRVLVDGQNVPVRWVELRRGANPGDLILTLLTDSKRDPDGAIYEFLKQPKIRKVLTITQESTFPRTSKVIELDDMRGRYLMSMGKDKLLIFANFGRSTTEIQNQSKAELRQQLDEAYEHASLMQNEATRLRQQLMELKGEK
jgi:uncharacterized protein (DUF58 family)